MKKIKKMMKMRMTDYGKKVTGATLRIVFGSYIMCKYPVPNANINTTIICFMMMFIIGSSLHDLFQIVCEDEVDN